MSGSSDESRIILRPTRWFLLRAGAMFLMLAVFGGWFLYDWKVGYPKQNLVYVLHNTFVRAGKEYAEMDAAGGLTPSRWETHVQQMKVDLPEGEGLLPPGTPRPMPWPGILGDHGRMAADGWHKLWLEFTAERRLPAKPPEHVAIPGRLAFDTKKMNEQMVMGGLCAALALGAGFVLVRTLTRTIEVDADSILTQDGRRVPFAGIDRLDRRKWESKGLAFAWYDDGGQRGRIRLDGLTYGGFRKEDGEPAEQLMQRLLANFSGELIDYAREDAGGDDRDAAEAEPAGGGQ